MRNEVQKKPGYVGQRPPARFNMARYCLEAAAQATPDKVALIVASDATDTNAQVRFVGGNLSASRILVGNASGANGTLASNPVTLPANGRFVRYGLSLKCLRDKGIDMASVAAPFIIASEGAVDLSLAEVRLGMDAEQVLPCA